MGEYRKEIYNYKTPYEYCDLQIGIVSQGSYNFVAEGDRSTYLSFISLMQQTKDAKDFKSVNFDNNFAKLLIQTNPHDDIPNTVYDNFLLNTTFEKDGLLVHGVWFTNHNNTPYVFGLGNIDDQDDESFSYSKIDDLENNEHTGREKDFADFMVSIYKNFCTFMSEYKIHYKFTDRVRTDEELRKREKRGQKKVPHTETKIMLSDELVRYYKHFEEEKKNTRLSLVRGHWRVLRSQRYKAKRNTKTWILPYMKGIGESINHTTRVLHKGERR